MSTKNLRVFNEIKKPAEGRRLEVVVCGCGCCMKVKLLYLRASLRLLAFFLNCFALQEYVGPKLFPLV